MKKGTNESLLSLVPFLNEYAATAAIGTLRLLHISRIIQNRIADERKGREGGIDQKLKRRIDEKKQAHGLRQE